MKNSKQMTLDKLARLMQGEFLSMTAITNRRFGGVGKRFDKTEEQLAKLEAEVAEMRIDLDNIRLRLGQEKVCRLEIKSLEKRLEPGGDKLGIKRNML